MQYRIVEFDNTFMIQAGIEVTKGFFRKKKVTEWHRTDINGQPLLYLPQIRIDTALLIGKEPLHKTLADAEAKIRSWQKGKTIHEVPNII